MGEQQSEVCVCLYFALNPALCSEGRCVCVFVMSGWMGGCAREWAVSLYFAELIMLCTLRGDGCVCVCVCVCVLWVSDIHNTFACHGAAGRDME